jgi:hypothetical protein
MCSAEDRKGHEPFKRLRRFFELLYSRLPLIDLGV